MANLDRTRNLWEGLSCPIKIDDIAKRELYRACILCEVPFPTKEYQATHTRYSSDCYFGGVREFSCTHEYIPTQLMLIIPHVSYEPELRADLEDRLIRYAETEKRLIRRANARLERAKAEYESRCRTAGFSEEQRSVASEALVMDLDERTKPLNQKEMAAQASMILSMFTFDILTRASSTNVRDGAYDFQPEGAKAHLECLEKNIPFTSGMYRSLAMQRECVRDLAPQAFVELLAKNPALAWYAMEMEKYGRPWRFLDTGKVTLSIKKYEGQYHETPWPKPFEGIYTKKVEGEW